MNFLQTLTDGEEGLFKSNKLTPMQKLTLRFVVVGLLYYGFAVVEGMIMRIYQVTPISMIPPNQYFAILTAHPLVGIFGSTYSIVFGAFLFLVPFLMKKPLWSIKLGKLDLWFSRCWYFCFLVRWFYFTLCTTLYSLLALTRRFYSI